MCGADGGVNDDGGGNSTSHGEEDIVCVVYAITKLHNDMHHDKELKPETFVKKATTTTVLLLSFALVYKDLNNV